MNQITPAPQLDLLPESAPFSPEQRAWLNGFFAGFTSPEGGMGTALSPEQNAAVLRRRRRWRSALARSDA